MSSARSLLAYLHCIINIKPLQVGVDDNATVIISGPTTDASPVGIDFYEMRRRNKQFESSVKNYNYGPFGVLLELVGADGAGYFHCNNDDGQATSTNETFFP